MSKKLTLVCAMYAFSNVAAAQQSNDQYFQEQQQRQQQAFNAEQARQGNDMSLQDEAYEKANTPAGHWKEKWGSIATDGAKGILGAAVDMDSSQLAESTAMADCQSKGGSPCKVQATYGNQCSALVTGDKLFSVQLAKTEQEASSIGLRKCNAEDINCRVYYSACSSPELVRN